MTFVWYVSDSCLICLRLMFDMSLTQVWYVSGLCLISIRLIFNMSQTCGCCPRLTFNIFHFHVPYVSRTGLTYFRLMSDIFQTHVWYVSDSLLICFRLIFDMSHVTWLSLQWSVINMYKFYNSASLWGTQNTILKLFKSTILNI